MLEQSAFTDLARIGDRLHIPVMPWWLRIITFSSGISQVSCPTGVRSEVTYLKSLVLIDVDWVCVERVSQRIWTTTDPFVKRTVTTVQVCVCGGVKREGSELGGRLVYILLSKTEWLLS